MTADRLVVLACTAFLCWVGVILALRVEALW